MHASDLDYAEAIQADDAVDAGRAYDWRELVEGCLAGFLIGFAIIAGAVAGGVL